MAQHAIVFDTFQYAKEQTKNLSEWIDDSLATKQDIKELDLKIGNVKMELGAEIAKMGYRTIAVLGGMIAASVAILGLLIKL